MSELNFNYQNSELAFAYGPVIASAIFRRDLEDFQVTEQLSFEPDQQGQHVLLSICKRDLNTQDVVDALVKLAQVKPIAVGYAGLKDKRAVTTQWFSVDLAGKPDPDWASLNCESIQVLKVERHSRKLKRGAIANNQFTILLRDINGPKDQLLEKLEKIKISAVPNYFGEQRFGNNQSNVKKAIQWFSGQSKAPHKRKRSIILSSARSYLFNQLLSHRVEQATWNQPMAGDVMMLRGTKSFFVPEDIDDTIVERCTSGDISVTGALWGQGELSSSGIVFKYEQSIAERHKVLADGLVAQGLQQQRRSLSLNVIDFRWDIQQDKLQLEFELPSGSYATAVIRELVNT